jgi:hypothetical protein
MQETVVGEGLALGCLSLGISAVTANKMSVESAFGRAWRSWPQAYLFRAVHASIARNDLLRIVARSTRRRGVVIASWDVGRVLEPILEWGDTVEEAGELLAENSGLPFSEWIALAKAFTDHLGADNVHRPE